MKNKVAFSLLLLLAVILLIFNILRSSIGLSPLQPGFQQRYASSILFPEGWGFFTRDPRTERIQLYRSEGSTVGSEVSFKSASARNLLGFSRKARRIQMEIARITAGVPDSIWSSQVTNHPRIEISRDVGLHFIKEGDYTLKKSWPVPWAWAKKKEYYPDHTRFASIRIIE